GMDGPRLGSPASCSSAAHADRSTCAGCANGSSMSGCALGKSLLADFRRNGQPPETGSATVRSHTRSSTAIFSSSVSRRGAWKLSLGNGGGCTQQRDVVSGRFRPPGGGCASGVSCMLLHQSLVCLSVCTRERTTACIGTFVSARG